MRPKLNPEGLSVLQFIAEMSDAMKRNPGKSVEEVAETLYGPNMVEEETTK